MANKLFGRHARVELYEHKGKAGPDAPPNEPTVSNSSRWGSRKGVWTFPELRIDFRLSFGVNKNQFGGSSLTIYNLSHENMRRWKKGDFVRIWAGHSESPPLVYGAGIVESVGGEWTEVDRVLKVELGDDSNHWLEAKVQEKWEPGVKTSQIVKDLIKKCNMEIGTVTPKVEMVYNNGFPVDQSKNVREYLDDLARDAESEVYVYGGKVWFHKPEKVFGPTLAIGPRSWPMIGSPEPMGNQRTEDQKNLQFKVAMVFAGSKLRPSQSVFIDSDVWRGVGRAINGEHDWSWDKAVSSITVQPTSR